MADGMAGIHAALGKLDGTMEAVLKALDATSTEVSRVRHAVGNIAQEQVAVAGRLEASDQRVNARLSAQDDDLAEVKAEVATLKSSVDAMGTLMARFGGARWALVFVGSSVIAIAGFFRDWLWSHIAIR